MREKRVFFPEKRSSSNIGGCHYKSKTSITSEMTSAIARTRNLRLFTVLFGIFGLKGPAFGAGVCVCQ